MAATLSEHLADQVLDAAAVLLEGLQSAAQRDGDSSLSKTAAADGDHIHRGVLTALLRVVFLLYAEDGSLMPVEHEVYQRGLSVTNLYEQLRADASAYPDSMGQRFGAWSYLLTSFRAVYLGAMCGDLRLPPRRGTLFDPQRFPFLEGWEAGAAAVSDAAARAAMRVPTVSDATVLAIFERLMMLEGQRISYRSLEVEQIGSVVAMQREIRAKLPIFHWMVEFPEVFYAGRPDPLDGEQVNRAAFMEAYLGNPPFLGGTRISIFHGTQYRDWLSEIFGTSGNTDLSAFFFRRCYEYIGLRGTVGLIATNTIAQGDTRSAGLSWLCSQGATIYAADVSVPWPGQAGVAVSIVCLGIGIPTPGSRLNGQPVSRITSFLSTRGQESPPAMLQVNRDVSVSGNKLMGIGFVFDDQSADATPLAIMRRITASEPRNRERIWRYVGGEDLNSDPLQSSERYVIDFGELTEAEARTYPDLFEIVEEKVKPARATVTQRDRREEWWRHANRSPVFRAYVKSHGRALAVSQVSAHLTFAFVPRDVVVSHSCVILLMCAYTSLAIVQSRVHESWARLLSSSMRNDLRYTPTESFETFPFPSTDPRSVIPALEGIGQRLYDSRAKYMVDNDVGLTARTTVSKTPRATRRASSSFGSSTRRWT